MRVELCAIYEIKMATGGHLEFLGYGGGISYNMYQTVFVPRNQLSTGGKMRSLSATVAEIWLLVTFGDMPQYFPQF